MIDLNFFETEIIILIYGTSILLAFGLGICYGYYQKIKRKVKNAFK